MKFNLRNFDNVMTALGHLKSTWDFYVRCRDADMDFESYRSCLRWISLTMDSWTKVHRDACTFQDFPEKSQHELMQCHQALAESMEALNSLLQKAEERFKNPGNWKLANGLVWTVAEKNQVVDTFLQIEIQVKAANTFYKHFLSKIHLREILKDLMNNNQRTWSGASSVADDSSDDSDDSSSPPRLSMTSGGTGEEGLERGRSSPPAANTARKRNRPAMGRQPASDMVILSESQVSCVSIPRFLLFMTEVAYVGQAWGHIRDEGTFSESPTRHKMYRLVSHLMSISGDSRWSSYTVQQWLRAGAWYLVLTRTCIIDRRGGIDESNIIDFYTSLLKAFWTTLCIDQHPKRPQKPHEELGEEERREYTQYINLIEGIQDAIKWCEGVLLDGFTLSQAIDGVLQHLAHATNNHEQRGTDGCPKLGDLWKFSTCNGLPETDFLSRFAGRTLEGARTCSVRRPLTKYPGQTEVVCGRAVLTLPRANEPVCAPIKMLACLCGQRSQHLQYYVSNTTQGEQLEQRDGQSCIDVYDVAVDPTGPELPRRMLRLCYDVSEDTEGIVDELSNAAKALTAVQASQTLVDFEISVAELPKSVRLTRSPFDASPPGARFYKAAEPIPAQRVKHSVQEERSFTEDLGGIKKLFCSPKTWTETVTVEKFEDIPARWPSPVVDDGCDLGVGRFCLQICLLDSSFVLRLLNLPLGFEIAAHLGTSHTLPANSGAKRERGVWLERLGPSRLLLILVEEGRGMVERPSNNSCVVARMPGPIAIPVEFRTEEDLNSFQQSYMIYMTTSTTQNLSYAQLEFKDWEIGMTKWTPRQYQTGKTKLLLDKDGRDGQGRWRGFILDTSNMADFVTFAAADEDTILSADGFLDVKIPGDMVWYTSTVCDTTPTQPQDRLALMLRSQSDSSRQVSKGQGIFTFDVQPQKLQLEPITFLKASGAMTLCLTQIPCIANFSLAEQFPLTFLDCIKLRCFLGNWRDIVVQQHLVLFRLFRKEHRKIVTMKHSCACVEILKTMEKGARVVRVWVFGGEPGEKQAVVTYTHDFQVNKADRYTDKDRVLYMDDITVTKSTLASAHERKMAEVGMELWFDSRDQAQGARNALLSGWKRRRS